MSAQVTATPEQWTSWNQGDHLDSPLLAVFVKPDGQVEGRPVFGWTTHAGLVLPLVPMRTGPNALVAAGDLQGDDDGTTLYAGLIEAKQWHLDETSVSRLPHSLGVKNALGLLRWWTRRYVSIVEATGVEEVGAVVAARRVLIEAGMKAEEASQIAATRNND